MMLDCAPWTLTHSSVGAAGLVLPFELPPSRLATKASRDAGVVVAEGDGEPVCAAEPVGAEDGDAGCAGLLLGVAMGAAAAADPLAEGELVGDEEGEGVGDDDGDGDGDGDGDAEGDAGDGSAWHTTFAAAAAFPCDSTGAACALPSTPRVRKPPLSRVTAATRTCPKRIRIACPR